MHELMQLHHSKDHQLSAVRIKLIASSLFRAKR